MPPRRVAGGSIKECPIVDQSSAFTELLFRWIDEPLLLAEDGVVIAANHRASELCARPSDAFYGLTLGAAIDLLYEHAEREPASIGSEAEVHIHRIKVEGRTCQLVAMSLQTLLTPEEELYRGLFKQAFEAYWITTSDGKILDFSDSYAALTGYSPAELRKMTIVDVDRENAGLKIAPRIRAVRLMGHDRIEIRQCERDSSRFTDLEVSLYILPRTGGHVLGCVRTIAKGRAPEKDQGSGDELERARQSLRLAEESLRLARSAQDRAGLLSRVCEQIVKIGGYAMAWVGVRDPDVPGTVRFEASAGENLEYLDGLRIDPENTLLASNAAGKRMAVCNDFGSAEIAPLRERAMRCGFASALSLPIRASNDDVEAILNIYARRPEAFEDEQLRVLSQVAGAVELGLELQRKRTLQKAVEKHARDWDENFRAAFESSVNGMLVYDLDGKILDANAELCNRLGYTRQELVGAHLTEIETSENVRLCAERLEAIRDEGFAAFETAHIARDGTIHPAAISCRTYSYDEGQIVLAICRDLEQPASVTERWLHLALEASQTGLFDWDLRTNKVAYSSEWKAQLGYKDEEIGNDFGEWELRIHPDDAGRVVEGLKAYLKKPSSGFEAEFRMRHKNGSYRWILARAAVLLTEDGQQERVLGSQTDITDRKRAEQQHQQVQKLESVGRVAAGVANDFDHLLTIINGYSDLILPDLYEGDPLKRKIEAIREAGGRAAALTHQLLGFSPRQAAAPRTVNLNAVVAGQKQILERLIGPDIELATESSRAPAYVSADPRQMTLLLANLVMNARDALPHGGRVTIGVELLPDMPPDAGQPGAVRGPQIRLSVTNFGRGEEETRLQVFDPSMITRESNCGGAGLATVIDIVKQHGGAIAVGSDVGKGTAFQVYLPAVQPGSRQQAPNAIASGAATVLVVDEDPALRGLMAETLRQSGHRVLQAANAGEALLLGQNGTGFDVLVAGVDLPGIPGSELATRLRQSLPDLKAVLTSSGDAGATDDNPVTGVAYLSKPFTPAALDDSVSRLLHSGKP
jgi:PAS domain S-box-containing protein